MSKWIKTLLRKTPTKDPWASVTHQRETLGRVTHYPPTQATHFSLFFCLLSRTHPNKFGNMCLSTARQSSHYHNNLKHKEEEEEGSLFHVGWGCSSLAELLYASLAYRNPSAIPVLEQLPGIPALRW